MSLSQQVQSPGSLKFSRSIPWVSLSVHSDGILGTHITNDLLGCALSSDVVSAFLLFPVSDLVLGRDPCFFFGSIKDVDGNWYIL